MCRTLRLRYIVGTTLPCPALPYIYQTTLLLLLQLFLLLLLPLPPSRIQMMGIDPSRRDNRYLA